MKQQIYISIFTALCLIFTSCEKEDEQAVNWKYDFSGCVPATSSSALEVVTFNIEQFRNSNYHDYKMSERLPYIASLIGQLDADVIALQEMGSEYWVSRLADELPGWESVFTPESSGSLSLAYLYKTSEIEVVEEETEAILDDWYAFPRSPFKIKVKHHGSGLEVFLINNHLKCCSGYENEGRRRDASEQLRDYIDTNLNDERVIVLGDLNDDISDVYSYDNVFWNFVEDANNYRFADIEIALGSSANFSYPGWPSHIDHILITNELFDNHQSSTTIKPSACQKDFLKKGSDHRPVMAVFK
ncbi:endonuclease/exonuclease/phosphatase family protein [Carboxylicivirga sp. N1Y90]|uniref:endonuclease/exonuclease/phosphatase family protein n=1 Tax=Carboxylicivirga fragile TaxID=3417571 RepID=UPI003D330050|nr:endonuclease/exonuclease/phosphatase family protein [Marinilabiliaceae bacterium N1Y90]